MKQITKEWLRTAKDDLDVIEKIIQDQHLSHVVAFHSQQCIEKVFKAIIEEFELGFVKIHSIMRLHNIVKNYISIGIDDTILEKLDKLYVDSRYPGDLGLLPNGKPSSEDAKEFLNVAQEIYTAIKLFLEKR